MNKISLTLFLLGSVFISENAYSVATSTDSFTPLSTPNATYIINNAVTDFCIFNKKSKAKLGCFKNGNGTFIAQKDFPITVANCNDLSACRTYQLDIDYAPSWSWSIWGDSDLFWKTRMNFVSNKPSCGTWYDQCLDKGCNADFMKNRTFRGGIYNGKSYFNGCEEIRNKNPKSSQKTWCSDLMDNYIYKDGKPCHMP